MEIQFLNLKDAYLELKNEFDQVWQDVNKDSFYILGKRLEKFEKEFANYLGAKHVIGVANGLDALRLSLKAFDIGSNDEVIVPAFTYIASWLAVSEISATPVPVEVNDNLLLDPNKIEAAISNKTKAIMPVHIYGRVCQMEEICRIAKKYSLKIIEDSAQSHGAFETNQTKKSGSYGNCSGFSFYPGKNLGCFGDGGCISTNDDKIAKKLRMLRNYGSEIRYQHEITTGNSRLDEIQAGILSVKLKHLDEWTRRRQEIAKFYIEQLQDISTIKLPEYHPGHVWHVFAIRTEQRKELQKSLSQSKIETNIHYPTPINLQKAYKHMNLPKGSFPFSERIYEQVLSLPIGPHLKRAEADYVVQKIKEFFK